MSENRKIQLRNGRVIELDQEELAVLKEIWKVYRGPGTMMRRVKVPQGLSRPWVLLVKSLHDKELFHWVSHDKGSFAISDEGVVNVLVKGKDVTLEDLAGLF